MNIEINNDSSIHGVIVQRPMPDYIDKATITNAIAPQKDIDCRSQEYYAANFLPLRRTGIPEKKLLNNFGRNALPEIYIY